MARGRPLPKVDLTLEMRQELKRMSRSCSLAQSLTQRTKIILMATDGINNTTIPKALGLSQPTVGKWRRRFLNQGLAGLYDEPKPGAPRPVSDEQVAVLIHRTLKTKPQDGTHWTCRSLAAETTCFKSTVNRVCRAFGLQPLRQKHFQLSTDPLFVEKVRIL